MSDGNAIIVARTYRLNKDRLATSRVKQSLLTFEDAATLVVLSCVASSGLITIIQINSEMKCHQNSLTLASCDESHGYNAQQFECRGYGGVI